MATFTLSTLSSGEASMTIDGNHYVLSKLNDETLSSKSSVKQLLEDWPSVEPSLQNLADTIKNDPAKFDNAKTVNELLDTPICFPNKLLTVGANYSDHLKEMGLPVEKWDPMPFFACPPSSSLVGPGKTVKYPFGTTQFDWECELVVVVGSRLRNASVEEASAAIAGYTIGLDLTCRDWLVPGQGGLIDLMRGKSQESMKPCGPSFVPRKFVGRSKENGHGLPVKLSVNGELMIDGNTADMIWTPEECLAEISKIVTLEPGDMIFTGTPSGSAKSHGERWLKVGDWIEAEIGKLGTLKVQVVA